VGKADGNHEFLEGDGHGQEIEASEGQKDGTGETADETRGSAGSEAFDPVLGTAQRFFG
jgi:hypothetical protein